LDGAKIEFDACLPFDASQRAFRNILYGMGDCRLSRLGRMFELMVVAVTADKVPTIGFESAYDFS
jgi:hypothetical protein